jgi:hypothetical protein
MRRSELHDLRSLSPSSPGQLSSRCIASGIVARLPSAIASTTCVCSIPDAVRASDCSSHYGPRKMQARVEHRRHVSRQVCLHARVTSNQLTVVSGARTIEPSRRMSIESTVVSGAGATRAMFQASHVMLFAKTFLTSFNRRGHCRYPRSST